MNKESYWKGQLAEYAKKDWINKPSIFAKQIVRYFPPQGKLLELAGGRGQDSQFFATKKYQVTYSDFAEEIVSDIKNNTDQDLGLDFQAIDTSKALPFENNTFDIVYSHMGLHYFGKEDSRKIFQEIHRILKEQGVVALLLNTIDDPDIKKYNYHEIEPNFFNDPRSNLEKSYYSVEYLQQLTKDIFEPMLMDNKGETYKDEVKTLIRFVAKRK